MCRGGMHGVYVKPVLEAFDIYLEVINLYSLKRKRKISVDSGIEYNNKLDV
jgi:hypothetical protein